MRGSHSCLAARPSTERGRRQMEVGGSYSCLAARPSTERGRILAVAFSVLLNVMFQMTCVCLDPTSSLIPDRVIQKACSEFLRYPLWCSRVSIRKDRTVSGYAV
jgi:hypothetical protein